MNKMIKDLDELDESNIEECLTNDIMRKVQTYVNYQLAKLKQELSDEQSRKETRDWYANKETK